MQSKLPIKYAYKVTDIFYIGEYPFEEEQEDGLPKLQKLLDFGIVHFINLTSERLTEYREFLPKHCTYTNLSTADYSVNFKPRKYTTRKLIDKAVNLDKVLIVHGQKNGRH